MSEPAKETINPPDQRAAEVVDIDAKRPAGEAAARTHYDVPTLGGGAAAATVAEVEQTRNPVTPAQGVLGQISDALRGGSSAPPTLTAEHVQELRQLARASKSTEPSIADELSTALGLAHAIRSGGYHIDLSYERLRFIFDCLVNENPQLTLARDERLRLQLDVYRQAGLISRLLARISAGSPAALVISALAASLMVWCSVLFLVRWMVDSKLSTLFADIFFMNGQALSVVTSAAFLGGVVSIVTRLREFSRVSDLDPFAMFWTAMLKPLTGVVLSVFILATLSGGVLGLGFLGSDFMGLTKEGYAVTGFDLPDKVRYMLWMLAFLAGFSERFAWDFVDRAQGIAQGKTPETKTP